jgi:hypothetical protein
MYARVARFTGADPEAIQENVERMRDSDGPPEGVPGKALTLLADESNGTVIAIGFFETEEDMRQGDSVLNSMTPPGAEMGTRASVDLCEVKLELED